MELIYEKTEAVYAELNKRVKAATSSYSARGDLYKRQNVRSRCLVQEFFLHRCFLAILIMVTEQLC